MTPRNGRRILAIGMVVLARLLCVPAGAQTAEDAVRFVFDHATLNPGSVAVFNPDGGAVTVQLLAPCRIGISRVYPILPPEAGGVRSANAQEPMTEVASIRLDQVDLHTGAVTLRENDGQWVSRFSFRSDPGAVHTRTVRTVEHTSAGRKFLMPDGYDEYDWPSLDFSIVEQAGESGRHKAAFEYLIGRFCAGKRSAY